MVPTPGSSWTKRGYVAVLPRMRPNYAFERFVIELGESAAPPAQGGRYPAVATRPGPMLRCWFSTGLEIER
jgi:hypothetical protein